ncbi:MAG: hypothetical protein AAF639_33290 [Chloroflexota bacterium]
MCINLKLMKSSTSDFSKPQFRDASRNFHDLVGLQEGKISPFLSNLTMIWQERSMGKTRCRKEGCERHRREDLARSHTDVFSGGTKLSPGNCEKNLSRK